VFTANPEDYTNRGSIVTPLKDRIDAQIITHYPKSIEIGKRITKQEARIKEDQKGLVTTNEIVHDLVEQVAVEARGSEFVDAKSGVSARLTISAYEQEGAGIVAEKLMGKAVRTLFLQYFPDPDKSKKLKNRPSPYKAVQDWFGNGNTLDLLHDASDKDYRAALEQVPGLRDIVTELHPKEDADMTLFLMEFLLHGLAEHSLISRNRLTSGAQFKDLLSSMFTMPSFGGEDDDEDEDEKPRRRR
jgi:magnesium chelatase subunit I